MIIANFKKKLKIIDCHCLWYVFPFLISCFWKDVLMRDQWLIIRVVREKERTLWK